MVRVYILVISYHLSMIVRLKDDCMKVSSLLYIIHLAVVDIIIPVFRTMLLIRVQGYLEGVFLANTQNVTVSQWCIFAGNFGVIDLHGILLDEPSGLAATFCDAQADDDVDN